MLDYPLEGPGAGSVTVLPAGPPPPNPAALLASESMRRIVRKLEGHADLVIIDSVAALAVSDALPLLRSVSGCLVIARMNRSSRAAVKRLQKMVGSAHGTVLGVVVTGSGAAMGGYASYRYTENGHRDGALGLLHLRVRALGRPSTPRAPMDQPGTLQARRRDSRPPTRTPALARVKRPNDRPKRGRPVDRTKRQTVALEPALRN